VPVATSASAPADVPASTSGDARYAKASNTSVTEAYNALKTYLMMGDRTRLEPGHMSDQLTRFWRGWLDANRGTMRRDQMIQSAERILSFAVQQMSDPAFPEADLNLGLVDETRENLRRVVKGMPARERVYAEIKARAATRFAPVTVVRLIGEEDRSIMAGSYAVSGAFTREAWDVYVKEAIKDAANSESHSTDWVLKTASADDLTLEGSPEQVQKSLTQLYKTEYAQEWKKFVQGVTIVDFSSFDQAVSGMNRLGDPANSPLAKVMSTVYEQTSWDNPSLLNEGLAAGRRSFVEWFKQTVLGRAPSGVNVNVDFNMDDKSIPLGPIGKEFHGLTRLMVPRDGGETLIKTYLQALSKVRGRFNQMKTQGDPGPAARKMMTETFEGGGELAEALKLVEEQMLNGMSDASKQSIRPLLVRPLMQAFGAIVRPTEAELNRVWMAQVFDPYQRALASKYPFDRSAKVEASPSEIAKVFGAEGTVAKFTEQSLGALVVRRGDVVTAKTWADMGVRLRPEFAAGLGAWIAPLGGQGAAGAASGSGAATVSDAQTVFQMLPLASPGLTEFTVEIDGQTLRYRNGVASWTHFVWPGPGTPGVRISGVTNDGRSVVFFNEPGRYGLEKMINSAQRRKLDGGVFELKWPQQNVTVALQLRIISNSDSGSSATASAVGNEQGKASGSVVGKPGALPSIIAGIPDDTAVSSVDSTAKGQL
ncbi:MAG TPA: ImcF-related family protein, partial [Aquabacterium sp.]|nr:ImcF-related family protein [Aquabacterium sp.]